MHTLDEEGNVSHYDIMFEHGLEKAVPAESFEVVKEVVHEHAADPRSQTPDEVNTELPAGPHGTVYVEPAIKSEEVVKEKRSFSTFRSIAEKK
jgi:hypothetical protein